MIDITPGLAIQGWTNEKELEWLAKQAQSRESICEIGCWKGRATVAMAHNTTGMVYAVDAWKGSPEHQGRDDLEGLYDTFVQNIRPFSNVMPLVAPSLQAVQRMKEVGYTFDMIFIDADHSYEAVKADILAWRPLLRPGGLLCGHDFDGGRPGVVRAVRELIPNIQLPAGSIWVAV